MNNYGMCHFAAKINLRSFVLTQEKIIHRNVITEKCIDSLTQYCKSSIYNKLILSRECELKITLIVKGLYFLLQLN